MKALLEKGQEVRQPPHTHTPYTHMRLLKVQEPYAEGWLQPVHLLGCICNEQHRQLVARLVLTLNRQGEHLRAALGAAGEMPAANTGGCLGSNKRVGAADTTSGKDLELEPEGYVQEELDRRIREGISNLADTMRAWGLGSSKAKMEEWVYLATAPQVDGDFAFNAKTCPLLWNSYISMLFVGFSDNTVLEQYVSQYRTVQDLRMDSPVI